jgi:hypothetical protein
MSRNENQAKLFENRKIKIDTVLPHPNYKKRTNLLALNDLFVGNFSFNVFLSNKNPFQLFPGNSS